MSSSVGLSSGIDYSSLLSKLRQASAGPITIAQNAQAKIQTQKQSLALIQSAVTAFQTAADALKSRSNFLTMTATTTDGNVLTANADGTASKGTYSVKVKQLATSDRVASQGIASADNTSVVSTTGKFSFKVGDGSQVDVDVTAGMNLNQLRDSINAKNSKVRASIINDGTDSNAYRMVLTSTETGAENAVKIVQNDTTLNLSTGSIEEPVLATDNSFNGTVNVSGSYTGKTTKNIVLEMTTAGSVGTAKYKVSYDGGLTWSANDAFTTATTDVDVTGTAAEGVNVNFADGTTNFAVGDRISIDAFSPRLQTAQDAIMEIDGVQIKRATNTFDDIVEGVTLTARQVDTDAVTVQVLNSNNSVSTKVSAFVDAYNTLLQTVKAQTKYDTDSSTAAALFGDSGVNAMMESFRQTVVGGVSALDSNVTMSSIGIKVGSDGTLSYDSTKFNTAMNNDLDAVVALFSEAGKSSNTDISLAKSTKDTQVGTYAVNITKAAEQATVTASQALVGGLTADETLTISDKSKSTSLKLTAGMKLNDIINSLNQKFSDDGLGLTAINENGKLRIATTEYGKEQVVRVTSSQALSASGQLGIGTEPLTDVGVDVEGTIDGVAATGDGRTLKSTTGRSKGLELDITLTAPGSGAVTLSRGVAQNLVAALEGYTDTTDGLFKTRNDSYDKRIEEYDTRISDLNERLNTEQATMQKRFNALELQLSELTSQGNYLQTQLASLISS
jgi:flagellar hook-associated protein 2